MSDKPIAAIISGVWAFLVLVICCGIGPVATIALISGTVSTGIDNVLGENYLGINFLTVTLVALIALIISAWLKRKTAEAMVKSEDT